MLENVSVCEKCGADAKSCEYSFFLSCVLKTGFEVCDLWFDVMHISVPV